jgi:hypothetical protein
MFNCAATASVFNIDVTAAFISTITERRRLCVTVGSSEPVSLVVRLILDASG